MGAAESGRQRRTADAKEQAAGALSNLAINNDDNQVAIVALGGIALLVELTRSGTAVAKEQAAAALCILAFNADNKKAMRRLGYKPS